MAQTAAAQGSPLTGAKVLAILITFFVVVFSVNGVMMFDAISTFRGQIADHPYEAGLKYNTELASATAQAQRAWKVELTMTDGLRASFRDAQGQPLTGLSVAGVFAAPADTKRDQAFEMTEVSPGVYAGPAAPSGMWDLRLTARRGDEVLFQSESRLTIDVPALAGLNEEHWRVSLTIAGRDAFATFREAEGRPVDGLDVSGVFVAPKGDRARNREFTAAPSRPGVYAIDPAALAPGEWRLVIVARRGAQAPFQSRNTVMVK